MPTLILNNVPRELYDCLMKEAAASRRIIEDQAIVVLSRALTLDSDDEQLAPHLVPPCELPRPGAGVRVSVRLGGNRLPDPPVFLDGER